MLANLETFGIKNVKPVFGMAPAVFHGLPAPDAIFIGGNGGEVARLMQASFQALRPGGRLVVNVGTLEMLAAVHAALKSLAPRVQLLLVNLARGVEQMESLRIESVNPTFLLAVSKPAASEAR
jgi:precorrin-6Y C5,15-methyltransferase (decarboxylating)